MEKMFLLGLVNRENRTEKKVLRPWLLPYCGCAVSISTFHIVTFLASTDDVYPFIKGQDLVEAAGKEGPVLRGLAVQLSPNVCSLRPSSEWSPVPSDWRLPFFPGGVYVLHVSRRAPVKRNLFRVTALGKEEKGFEPQLPDSPKAPVYLSKGVPYRMKMKTKEEIGPGNNFQRWRN
ncbi:hypothetical protein MJT46_000715 [Ovis ammon polii x Ovis aries]|nr:hypothetical protein MJT46_000715 [Ovis ammon polii x Ovis aries]